jgi:hypothetical protein
MLNSKRNISKTFWAISILTLLGAIAWRLCSYYYLDDVSYMHIAPVIDQESFWFGQCPMLHSVSDVFESAVNHYLFVNGRLANMICMLSMLFPRWIVDIADGIMTFLMYVLLMRVTKRSYFHYNPIQTIVGLLYFGLAFTWYSYMQSSDFLINYVWTSVGALFLISQINHSDRLSKVQVALVAVLAVFVNWMHEAFACSLVAYTFILWAIGNKSCRKSRFIIGLGLCIGLVIAVISPGTMCRADGHVGHIKYIIYHAVRCVSELWPLWLSFIATFGLRKKVGAHRFKAYMPLILASYAGAMASLAISLICLILDRGLWPVYLYVSIPIMAYVDAVVKPKKVEPRWMKIVLALAVCAYAAWFVQLTRWQWRFSNERKDVHQLLIHSTSPIVYYDLTSDNDVPSYLLGIVFHEGYSFGGGMDKYAVDFFGRPGMIVLPTKYKGVPLRDLKIAGNTKFCGNWPYLYSYDDSCTEANVTVGRPGACVTILNRMIMALGADTVSHPLRFEQMPIKDFEGNTIYVHYREAMGRSIYGREFLRIDKLEEDM